MKSRIENIATRINALVDKDIMDFYGLHQGELGLILFQVYFYKYNRSEETKKAIINKIEAVFESMNNSDIHSCLATGFSGLYYIIKLLESEKILHESVLSDNVDIKNYINQSITKDYLTNDYYLLYGYIGKIITNISEKEFKNTIIKSVDILNQNAIQMKEGIAWYDIKKENNVINMGLAHGVPSITRFLTIIYSNKIEVEHSKKLVHKSIEFLLNEMDDKEISFFPYEIPKEIKNSRLAWCYGDLSNSYVLLLAGKTFNKPEWINIANIIANKTQTRGLDEAMLNFDKNINRYDNGFCHGTAGIAFLYKKLFLETSNQSFYESYLEWMKYTVESTEIKLNYLEENYNKSKTVLEGTNYSINDEISLIEGISGVGLVLLDYLSPEHDWEKIFLL